MAEGQVRGGREGEREGMEADDGRGPGEGGSQEGGRGWRRTMAEGRVREGRRRGKRWT